MNAVARQALIALANTGSFCQCGRGGNAAGLRSLRALGYATFLGDGCWDITPKGRAAFKAMGPVRTKVIMKDSILWYDSREEAEEAVAILSPMGARLG